MNFLQICQEANRLSGMQGTLSTVAVSTGYQLNLVNYCAQAYIDLQELRKDWPWMRSSATFYTVASTYEYSIQDIVGIGNPQNVARWVKGMILYINSESKTSRLREYSYDRYIVKDVATQEEAKPWVFAEDPVDHHLYLNPPDDVYTITVHYYTTPEDMDENTDIPVLPISFHQMIAYRGAALQAAFMGNTNLYTTNQNAYDAMLGMLMRSEYPGKKVNLKGGAA